jgi:hypothetical protein
VNGKVGLELLIEQYKLLKIQKIEALASTLSRILEELSKRNFENVGTKDLISIAFTIESKLKESISDQIDQFKTGYEKS